MINNVEKAKEILLQYKQNHIVNFMNNLDLKKKQKLASQVLTIDFEEMKELYKKTNEDIYSDLEEMLPITAINPDRIPKEKLQEYVNIGRTAVEQNKFAVATMAGGQGTRLGHNMPKGTYKLDVGKNGKYLFEIIIDNLKRANEEYNVIIPWYIMTSRENNLETVKFLEGKNYFGYPKEYVSIFIQDELPLLDEQGKMLIDKNGLIKEAANGNGGIFRSMKKSKILEDMEKRGIEWIFIGSVDNVLLKNVDTLLLGLTISNKTKIGTRTVLKRDPEEKVGVFCKKNGKVKVVEYTELPKDIAKITDKNGELVFGESHIMCNLFNIEALKKASSNELKYHVAFKKSNFIDEKGEYIEPKKPNAYKFEQFIQDSLNLFDDISILRGKREEDFAPVKNKEGVDSPETAKKLYENYWKNN